MLPPEILETIVYEAIIGLKYYQELFSIRSVCKYWKEVIDTTPRLWTIITSALDQNMLAMALRNSSTHPLYVQHTSRSAANFKVFVDLAARSAERWRELECRLTCPSDYEQLLSLPLRKLQSLKIVGATGTSYKRPLDTPELTTLNVWSFPINWTTLSGLHSLTIGNTPGPSMGKLFNILKASPQLESLVLWKTCPVYTTGNPDPSASPVLLSRLNAISFHELAVQSLSYIIDLIEAPNLQTSRVTMRDPFGAEDCTQGMRSVGRHIGAYRPLKDGIPIEVSVDVSDRRFRFAIGGFVVEYWGTRWTEGSDLPERLAHLTAVMERMDPKRCEEVQVLALEGGGDGEIAKCLPVLHRRFPQIEELVVKDIVKGGADSCAICGQLSWLSQSEGAGERLFPNLTRLRFDPSVELVYDRILPLLEVRKAEEQTKTIMELKATGGTIHSKMEQALRDSVQVLELTGVEIVEE